MTTSLNSEAFTPLDLNDKPYAYLTTYQSIKDLKWLCHILQNGIKVRSAEKAFSIGGRNYQQGSLVILRWDNLNIGNKFDQILKSSSEAFLKLT